MNINHLAQKLKQDPLVKAVYQISQQVETPIYMVGGAIRDLLTGILPEKDFDFVMKSNLATVARLFSEMVSGHLIRWSSNPVNYRVVFYRNHSLIKVDFSEFRGNDIYQDLAHRDFTINAIALMINELFQGEEVKLYDPLGGNKDIQGKSVRFTSPHAFHHDPLRMLRAVRIAKERSFTIEVNTKEEICRQKERLFSVSAERIRSEFFKIISLPGVKDSLRELDDLGLLSLLLPETEILKGQEKEESRTLSRWEHALETAGWCEWALDYPGELFPNLQHHLNPHFCREIEADVNRGSLLKLSGLLHECEKSFNGGRTKPYLPYGEEREKSRHFLSAVQTGQAGVDNVTKRFRLGKMANKILKKVTACYPSVFLLSQRREIQDRVYFRYFRDVGSDGIDVLILSWADLVARGSDIFHSPLDLSLRELINRLAHYYFEEFTVKCYQPLVTGKDIIERFGLKEGRVIGELLNRVARAEFEGFLSSPQEALAYVEKLVKIYSERHK